jgi:hypothetical protein
MWISSGPGKWFGESAKETGGGMPIDCDRTMATVYSFLGRWPMSITYTSDDLEFAFQHVRLCAACRNTFSPEENLRFINGVVLERE